MAVGVAGGVAVGVAGGVAAGVAVGVIAGDGPVLAGVEPGLGDMSICSIG